MVVWKVPANPFVTAQSEVAASYCLVGMATVGYLLLLSNYKCYSLALSAKVGTKHPTLIKHKLTC